MDKAIKTLYPFDFVHDGQKVFRELLSAQANPGQIRNIIRQADKFEGDYQTLLALGCTLLDNEERMYVEKNPRLSSELHSLTLCREADLNQADYVFLSSEMNYGSLEQILKNVKHGTYEDPQESATIILLCSRISGEENLCLSGPGIDGEYTLNVYPYVKKVIQLRNSLKIEYPLGVDLIFVDLQGNLLGIPRLVKVN